jgi:hypothetical protein
VERDRGVYFSLVYEERPLHLQNILGKGLSLYHDSSETITITDTYYDPVYAYVTISALKPLTVASLG